jgi:hypothetical protein
MSPELIPWKIILAVTQPKARKVKKTSFVQLDPVLEMPKCPPTLPPPPPQKKREEEISCLKSWMLLLEYWRLLLSLEVLLMDI